MKRGMRDFFRSVEERIKSECDKYHHIFYSPKKDEICLVKSFLYVDGVISVDRTKRGIFGYYERKTRFEANFIYVGEL